MPFYDIRCPNCGEHEVFSQRSVVGEVPCSECGTPSPKVFRKTAKVSTFSTEKDVPGLGKGFKTWREVESAADRKGMRIMEDSEMVPHREAAKQESADYAKQLGFGSRQEYVEARKARGSEMVAEARAKKLDRAVRKYGSAIRQEVEEKKAAG